MSLKLSFRKLFKIEFWKTIVEKWIKRPLLRKEVFTNCEYYKPPTSMTNYPTHVSNSQWQIISNFKEVNEIEIRFAGNSACLLYLVKTGCRRRMLNRRFSKWPL
jgi:hypothetical protein